jgi:hypothetical protein
MKRIFLKIRYYIRKPEEETLSSSFEAGKFKPASFKRVNKAV